ncbi:uncharacterized protein K452DRAFT_287688 [Aplosporella prunicola CBS 121167]|uniref:5-Methylcytosine G/T mismatch-specific DNA glycosylase n=1 Tax=Aplosporella prunicola CBS 121167 TaxID=1176127 RepID=A0A6A6BFN5_9PEZI|nr:uncharacterized protein K452DRAFT_287688 [Aplosporella prunicola CBS 121167]KAF2141727.1 hypothetical protein K452DRAFT_287688 [Aplosporella prunicola CBS 121167]
MDSKDAERRRRRKEHDSDLDSTKSRDPERHKSSRSHRSDRPERTKSSRSKERHRDSSDVGSTRSRRSHSHSNKVSIVPEMDRRSSLASSGISPYPSFSKAHSKESLGPKDDVNPRQYAYTPEPTDLGSKDGHSKDGRSSPMPKPRPSTRTAAAPPSPPLTAEDPDLKRSSSKTSMRRSGSSHKSDRGKESGRRSADGESRKAAGPKSASSKSSLRQSTAVDDGSEMAGSSKASKPSTLREHALKSASSDLGIPETRSQNNSTVTQSSATDSDATSIAPNQPKVSQPPISTSNHDSSPATIVDSSPRTPTHPAFHPTVYNVEPGRKETPVIEVLGGGFGSRMPSVDPFAGGFGAPPPPPPPPVMVPTDAPRVDYLLQNGGLNHTVPKILVAAVDPTGGVQQQQQQQQQGAPMVRAPPTDSVRVVFAPFQKLLEDYTDVVAKNGSIAVATGYRSVARRLLDRLEAVFARNISSEACNCIMCRVKREREDIGEEDTGVSWGEILEFVSGRRELPAWPPFSIDNDSGLGISSGGQEAPMQKLDIDVPEEYKDHYIKQSKKTKLAVQNWLASQPEIPSSPPQEVDDETLTFAMLTHLEQEKRPLFTALLRGMSTLPASRAPTPLNVPRSELLAKTAMALQRLYRLEKPPRDPECAMFLLNHPALHGVLATMAAVSNGEWEILVSGRFDGFLWSGAEGQYAPPTPSISRAASRGPSAAPISRTTTPFSAAGVPSRGTTPFSPGRPSSVASFGAPVQMDEEVEIATLAEVEREIYLGMEALEDAFEALHCKAESVRRALRERSAGLAMAAQARRGSNAEEVEVRLGTPASGVGSWNGFSWEAETDDGLDGRSELAPDDSASNISYNRKRRKAARKERATPALVEEDESVYEEPPRRR